MYLRAAKTEAEDAGIETDGMANSISELRSNIMKLSGVDIMLDSDTFKSTYQILKDLSKVWDELTDVSRANILETIGGKRNANVVSSLLTNFSSAESALVTASNSAGSALRENEVYLDSITGRTEQLQATFQSLSQNIIDDGTIKGLVSTANVILRIIDKIVDKLGMIPLLGIGAGIAKLASSVGEPTIDGFNNVPTDNPTVTWNKVAA